MAVAHVLFGGYRSSPDKPSSQNNIKELQLGYCPLAALRTLALKAFFHEPLITLRKEQPCLVFKPDLYHVHVDAFFERKALILQIESAVP